MTKKYRIKFCPTFTFFYTVGLIRSKKFSKRPSLVNIFFKVIAPDQSTLITTTDQKPEQLGNDCEMAKKLPIKRQAQITAGDRKSDDADGPESEDSDQKLMEKESELIIKADQSNSEASSSDHKESEGRKIRKEPCEPDP